MSLSQLVKAIAGRALPQPLGDGVEDPNGPRIGRYHENYVLNLVPTKHLLADEGSYFVATNPTIGTGVAHALVTAFSATSGLFVMKNNSKLGDSKAKRVYLDYLKLLLTAAPTAGVSLEFAIVLDDTVRSPTANNVAVTPVNTNMDDSTGSICQVQAFSTGALTVPVAGQSARTAARVRIPTGVNVVGDEYRIQFGNVDQTPISPPLTALRATQPSALIGHGSPIIIGPQQYIVVHRWSLTEATAAPSYEWELAWWER